jgi:hypothetical protein
VIGPVSRIFGPTLVQQFTFLQTDRFVGLEMSHVCLFDTLSHGLFPFLVALVNLCSLLEDLAGPLALDWIRLSLGRVLDALTGCGAKGYALADSAIGKSFGIWWWRFVAGQILSCFDFVAAFPLQVAGLEGLHILENTALDTAQRCY